MEYKDRVYGDKWDTLKRFLQMVKLTLNLLLEFMHVEGNSKKKRKWGMQRGSGGRRSEIIYTTYTSSTIYYILDSTVVTTLLV